MTCECKSITFCAIFALFYISTTLASPSERMVGITREDLNNLFRNHDAQNSFQSTRHPLFTNQSRIRMANFIDQKFKSFAPEGNIERIEYQKIEFSTPVVHLNNEQPVNVQCQNFILILKGHVDKSDDEPIMISANYDTEEYEIHPIDDNGSGVVAILALADQLTREIKNEALKLERTVILAILDASLNKYQANKNPDGKSGSYLMAQEWLPKFMDGRKAFKGAIILDSILNFNDTVRSQFTQGFDKAFPDAYQEMSHREFRGDFLALVGRSKSTDSSQSLDQNLMDSIENGWKQSMFQPKTEHSQGGNTGEEIDPALIRFEVNLRSSSNEPITHFLKSNQYEFWNHNARVLPTYPAVLLTDTRSTYRKANCARICDRLDVVLNQKNLAFMHRTVLTLRHLVDHLQTKNTGERISSGSLFFISLLGIVMRHIFVLNA